ncbi:glutathione-dependent disulfide-bond oxidoreductase [Sessilibacter sp. MAH2]
MADEYQPPKIWTLNSDGRGKWDKVNRPISGATHEKELPRGEHAFQLYSLGTPNGQKATIMFEELLEAGVKEAEYDAFLIDIGEGDQFSSGFVGVNPNSKIPALLDYSGEQPVRVFESGAILLYLAEKFGKFIPENPAEKVEMMNWLFWLQGSAPYLGGGFGHFYHYAPIKIEYAIDRYTMETKRQLDLLNKILGERQYLSGSEYTIADIATWCWYGLLVRGALYDAKEFLQVHEYENVVRWANEIYKRPGVRKGRIVNRTWGPENEQLRERHSASDFDGLNITD